MPKSTRLLPAFVVVLFALGACNSTSQPIGKYPDGSAGTTGNRDAPGADVVPSVFCSAFGQPCTTAVDCCSGICDPTTLSCAASINKCTPTGGACVASTECCSLSCSAGSCSAAACVADEQPCSDAAACCSGSCNGVACEALNLTCRTAGNPCTANPDCCSKWCDGGVCKLGSSFCIQTGDVCSDSSTCCSGDCQPGTGTLGTCAPPPSGATYCSDAVDGTVCDACNGCCSRLCAPYAATGIHVCQPASGCRVNGDLCRKDSDCCGAAGTGLPGEDNVTCEIPVGKTLGICRNPRSCNPQGNVCHYKDYTCSVSSARNDCCAAVGNSGVCQLDFLGVPRCNGLGTTCIPGGGICSSTMDCCDMMPCVPDGTGLLRCYLPPGGTIDGGVPQACVPTGGRCSINADCCGGLTCIEPIGSTQGVCGIPQPPPGNKVDAGTSDTPGPGCIQFGQLCTTSADCCNGLPCWNGRCMDEIIP
jgi:hypothetical protein